MTAIEGTHWRCRKCGVVISHAEFELFDGFCRPCVLGGGNLYTSPSDIKRSIKDLEDNI
tara:strand:+ start:313 stop:489 length:177 start_codon:yes stop_codon:yes gene_type:complete